MKDFKSYASEQPDKKPADENNGQTGAYNNTVELAKILSKAMNGKSESQILHTIITEAERGKREGTLTNQDLDNFYNMVSPMVDGFKRKKLKEVVTRLKNI